MMKAHIRPTKNQINQAKVICGKAITQSTARYGWIMAVALNEEYGFGEKRILRLMGKVTELAEEFDRLRNDDVEEEVLLRRIQQIIPGVKSLYPEQ